jgi:hypothetical protein
MQFLLQKCKNLVMGGDVNKDVPRVSGNCRSEAL